MNKLMAYFFRFSPVFAGLFSLSMIVFMINRWQSVLTPVAEPDNATFITTNTPQTKHKTAALSHVFGEEIGSAATIAVSQDYQVQGILGADTAQASAIIAIDGDLGKVYCIGNRLPNGNLITKITQNAVFLKSGNHLVKLELPHYHGKFFTKDIIKTT